MIVSNFEKLVESYVFLYVAACLVITFDFCFACWETRHWLQID